MTSSIEGEQLSPITLDKEVESYKEEDENEKEKEDKKKEEG